jgi:inhibitor of KinA sporulation pathway (predicted exonuclease)
MATTINEEKKIKLFDGTELSIRPLKISLLRTFTKKFEQIQAVADDNDKSMNLLMECVQIAMQQYNPELAGDIKKLEELLDLPTVYKIVEEASGNSALFASLNK